MKTWFSIKKALVYTVLLLTSFISVFPFYWMIVGMTNTSVEVIKGRMIFGGELINNLRNLFTEFDMTGILLNSLKVSVLTMVGTLIVASMAAYGFEIYVSRLRERIYTIMLLSMMIPFAALMIPLFRLIVSFGLLNNHFGLIITSIASVFIIFFFRQSFKSFPKDIIQAARVDGASEFGIFLFIVIPSMRSTFAAAAIYSFMTSWNAYMWPLIVLQTDNKKTVTLLISNMSSAYFPDYGAIMAAIVIATLPIIVIFFTLQKYFVQGMLGSVKQ